MHALDATVQDGLLGFQRGDFRAAHDAWAEGWGTAQGLEKHLFQALLQLAAGFHEWKRANPEDAALLLERARRHLGGIPSSLLGLDVSELELELEAWQESAARGEPAPASPRLHVDAPADGTSAHRHRPRCPYCGERVEVQAEPVGVAEETYVEDCPVCCRPWTVRVSRAGSGVEVTLGRDDD